MMNEIAIKKKPNINLRNTIATGLIIRVLLLIFILTIGLSFSDPYFIIDDRDYEEQARIYLDQADNLVDLDLLDNLLLIQLQPFWTIVMSISAYIMKTIYAGRILNVILSTICISVVYKLTYAVSEDDKSAIKAARLFAYLPVTVFTCCFPIKDIYITLGVTYAFYVFVMIQKKMKVTPFQIVMAGLLLTGVYYARGAVTEIMLIFGGVYYLGRLARNKRYIELLITLVILAGVLMYFMNSIYEAIELKINDYAIDDEEAGGGIRFLQINSIGSIYKLPFTYLFASLQPITLNLFSIGNKSIWLNIIAHLNISMYPIAIGNFLYIFQKKDNWFFWATSFAMYSAVIILSLGVFRHYMFLLPIQMINYSICITEKPYKKSLVTVGSVGLFFVVMLLTMISAI